MKNKPNILFVFSDQQHWEAVGFNDGSFDTPNLNRLAAEGTVFSNAFCTTPQCSPSRSSMLTGMYPAKTGVIGNVGQAGGSPLKQPTVGKMLQQAGYRTAYFGKWHLGKNEVGTAGWDEDFGVVQKEQHDDEEATRLALDFMQRAAARPDEPFALFLSYNDPHDIYHYGREAKLQTPPAPRSAPAPLPPSWQGHDFESVPGVQHQFMLEDQGKIMAGAESPAWERYRELYREKVKLYDNHVGRVLGALEAHGLLERTMIIATSDHGDMDAQHRLIFKGPFMYEHMMRVPLIIRRPGVPAGRTVDYLTPNVDLVPTMADWAGFDPGATDGVSLDLLLTGVGRPPERDFVIGQYYSKQRWINPIRMIRTDRLKYNLYRVHGEELYDLQNDPHELKNLADDPDYAERKDELAARLEGWLRENGDDFHELQPTTRDGQPLNVGN
ncbi:MAG: sulfatase-like hydrolase/transferase [Lentisphaerae bacterium]|nr:sulfatase-like hydrolase/transferase [Lentisphaerota bacterium]